MLTVGELIPNFSLFAIPGGPVSASTLRGARAVLYFYPADDTPGCTAQACSFRDRLPRFNGDGVRLYGISPQGSASHMKFAAKYNLNFPLIADDQHTMAESFGVWVEKSMYGRKYMGVQRATFVIAPDGYVEKVWEKVKLEGHADEVLAYLRGEETPAPKAKAKAKPKPKATAAAKKTASPAKAVKKTARKTVKKATPKSARGKNLTHAKKTKARR